MRSALTLALALLVALVGSAHAQFNMMVQGPSGPTYQGIGDVQAMTRYYSCTWAYTAAYATAHGKLCTVQRASDSETCDILAATGGGQGVTANCSGADNGVSLATFLTSTSGTWTKAYNQVANGTLDLPGSTTKPGVLLNCKGTNTCVQTTANNVRFESTTNNTPVNGTATFLGYGNRASGTSAHAIIVDNANGGAGLLRWTNGVANSVSMAGPSGSFTATAADNAWHALIGTSNGASSVLNVDGTETTGTVTGNTTVGHIQSPFGSTGTLDWMEGGELDGTVLNSTVRAALIANMQARN